MLEQSIGSSSVQSPFESGKYPGRMARVSAFGELCMEVVAKAPAIANNTAATGIPFFKNKLFIILKFKIII